MFDFFILGWTTRYLNEIETLSLEEMAIFNFLLIFSRLKVLLNWNLGTDGAPGPIG